MAREIYALAVTIPAGTAIANATTTVAPIPQGRRVERVEWRVPPGPRGNVGWQLAAAGKQFIPQNLGTWLVTDNEGSSWDLVDQVEGVAWQVIAYNLGSFSHTIYFRFLCALVGTTPPLLAAPLSRALLSSGG